MISYSRHTSLYLAYRMSERDSHTKMNNQLPYYFIAMNFRAFLRFKSLVDIGVLILLLIGLPHILSTLYINMIHIFFLVRAHELGS